MSTKKWVDITPPLSPWLLDVIETMGFTEMTPVQAAVIPLFRGNKDVVVEAVTGSGKTLAFLIPIIERILSMSSDVKPGQCSALVISPTRELAEQIYGVLNSVVELAPEGTNIRTQLIIGGGDPTHVDLKKFLAKRPHVLVATPGRLLELLQQPQVHMKALEVLTLDEADRLLELGFETTLSSILSYMPKQRRTGLFSATISDALNEVVRVGLRNPVKVVVSNSNKAKTPTSLQINYMVAEPREKLPMLLDMIKEMPQQNMKKAIVYFPSCQSVTYFYSLLTQLLGSDCETKLFTLHGKLPPGPRHKTLQKFIECTGCGVLLATDVAARGLDIPEVDHVLQLNPPQDPNMFLHRAGRAGRAGRQGTCTVLLHPGREESYVDFMSVRKVNMVQKALPELANIDTIEAQIRQFLLQDRAHHDAAIRSFTAFVRFYSQHTATSIFRVNDLDLKQVGGHSYYLIRLPRMPELKGLTDDETYVGDKVDMDTYAYVDPQREKARLKELESKQKVRESKPHEQAQLAAARHKNDAWSGKQEKKQHTQDRRTKRKAQNMAKAREKLQENGNNNESDSDSEKETDWKDLVRERKRAKKGSNQEVTAAFDDL